MKIKIGNGEVYEIAMAEELSVREFLATFERLNRLKNFLQTVEVTDETISVKPGKKIGRPKGKKSKVVKIVSEEQVQKVKSLLEQKFQVRTIKKLTKVPMFVIRKIKKSLKGNEVKEVEVKPTEVKPDGRGGTYDRETIVRIMKANLSGNKELFLQELNKAGMSYNTYYVLRKNWISRFNITAEELGVTGGVAYS